MENQESQRVDNSRGSLPLANPVNLKHRPLDIMLFGQAVGSTQKGSPRLSMTLTWHKSSWLKLPGRLNRFERIGPQSSDPIF